MKKIVLITSFCNTEEKLQVLYNNILTIKKLDLDIMVFSHFYLPEYINNVIDYTIISKENPVSTWPEKYINQWYSFQSNDASYYMSVAIPDYGYAVLNQIKRLADLALSMDYEHFFIVDYDVNINEHVTSVLMDNRPNSFFPGKKKEDIFAISLYLISLDKEHLINFKNLISKKSYLSDAKDSAESWLHKALPFIPGIIENEPVEDLVYNYENFNFFNYSIIDNINLFIHKIQDQDIKLIFHGFSDIKTFKIKTEDFEQEYEIKEWDEIILPYKIYDSFMINYEQKEYNFTNILNKITFNIFNKTNI